MRRCVKCILPESYPHISFDKDGVCSFCRDFENNLPREKAGAPKKNETLEKLIRQYKSKKGKYDVIVPMSGGKDSSYAAYALKKIYGMKVLGVNYDNGNKSELASKNINTLANKLGIEIVTLKPDLALMNKLYAHFFVRRGEPCTACNAMGYLVLATFAARERIILGYPPLVAGGWSRKYEYERDVYTFSMKKFAGAMTDNLLKEISASSFVSERILQFLLKQDDVRMGLASHPRIGTFIQLPDYIRWDYRHITGDLTDIGWAKPPETHESHFDCLIHSVLEYLTIRKYGFSQEVIKNSVLIRDGQMTREEALKKVSYEQKEEPAVLNAFLSRLGISRDDINWGFSWEGNPQGK